MDYRPKKWPLSLKKIISASNAQNTSTLTFELEEHSTMRPARRKAGPEIFQFLAHPTNDDFVLLLLLLLLAAAAITALASSRHPRSLGGDDRRVNQQLFPRQRVNGSRSLIAVQFARRWNVRMVEQKRPKASLAKAELE